MTAIRDPSVISRPASDRQVGTALIWRAAACLSVLALWLIGRPYGGVWHDARLYIGAVLARLSPDAVGRDLMFAFDGQFGFTAFGAVAEPLVEALGPSSAALLLSGAGAMVWMAAVAFLVTRFVRGVEAWAALIAVAALPGYYGLADLLRYGESFATARPFAEAGVLTGVGLLISGRRWAALAPLTLAALFHPVMALTGFAVLFWVLAWEDRRWWGAAGLAVLGALGAAAAGVPIAERLLQPVDGAWLEVLRLRTPLVLLAAWPPESFGRILVQAVTAVIAAALLQGRARLVFAGVAVVALGGVACSAVLGDLLHSVLILQLQPWRALWLLAVAAAAGFGVCAVRLWPLGWPGRLVLAALALAWTGLGDLLHGPPVALLALGAFAWRQRGREIPGAKVAALCLAAVAAVRFAGLEGALLSARIQGALNRPGDLPLPELWWLSSAHSWLAAGTVLAALAARRASMRTLAPALCTALLAAGLLLAAVSGWDQRSAVRRAAEQASQAGPLRAALMAAPGGVLWLDGEIEPWTVAHRPAWWSMMHGAPAVFSRELALEWSRRHRILAALGLAWPLDDGTRQRWAPESRHAPWTPGKLSALCLRSDAPAWVVVPVLEGAQPPASTAALWRSGAVQYRQTAPGVLTRIGAYAALPCAARR
jgi:hypothetical protein